MSQGEIDVVPSSRREDGDAELANKKSPVSVTVSSASNLPPRSPSDIENTRASANVTTNTVSSDPKGALTIRDLNGREREPLGELSPSRRHHAQTEAATTGPSGSSGVDDPAVPLSSRAGVRPLGGQRRVHQFHHHRRPDNFADDQMSRSQGVPDTGLDTRLGRVEQALDELNKHITDNDHKSRQLQKKVLRKFASSLKETEERLQEQVLKDWTERQQEALERRRKLENGLIELRGELHAATRQESTRVKELERSTLQLVQSKQAETMAAWRDAFESSLQTQAVGKGGINPVAVRALIESIVQEKMVASQQEIEHLKEQNLELREKLASDVSQINEIFFSQQETQDERLLRLELGQAAVNDIAGQHEKLSQKVEMSQKDLKREMASMSSAMETQAARTDLVTSTDMRGALADHQKTFRTFLESQLEMHAEASNLQSEAWTEAVAQESAARHAEGIELRAVVEAVEIRAEELAKDMLARVSENALESREGCMTVAREMNKQQAVLEEAVVELTRKHDTLSVELEDFKSASAGRLDDSSDELQQLSQAVDTIHSTRSIMSEQERTSMQHITTTAERQVAAQAAQLMELASAQATAEQALSDLRAQVASSEATRHEELTELKNDVDAKLTTVTAEVAGVQATVEQAMSDLQAQVVSSEVSRAGAQTTAEKAMSDLRAQVTSSETSQTEKMAEHKNEVGAKLTAMTADVAEVQVTVEHSMFDLRAQVVSLETSQTEKLIVQNNAFETKLAAVTENVAGVQATVEQVVSELGAQVAASEISRREEVAELRSDAGLMAELRNDSGQKMAALTEEVAECRKEAALAAIEQDAAISDLRASSQAMEESLALEPACRQADRREAEMVMTELALRVEERMQSCVDMLAEESRANLELHGEMETAVESLREDVKAQIDGVTRETDTKLEHYSAALLAVEADLKEHVAKEIVQLRAVSTTQSDAMDVGTAALQATETSLKMHVAEEILQLRAASATKDDVDRLVTGLQSGQATLEAQMQICESELVGCARTTTIVELQARLDETSKAAAKSTDELADKMLQSDGLVTDLQSSQATLEAQMQNCESELVGCARTTTIVELQARLDETSKAAAKSTDELADKMLQSDGRAAEKYQHDFDGVRTRMEAMDNRMVTSVAVEEELRGVTSGLASKVGALEQQIESMSTSLSSVDDFTTTLKEDLEKGVETLTARASTLESTLEGSLLQIRIIQGSFKDEDGTPLTSIAAEELAGLKMDCYALKEQLGSLSTGVDERFGSLTLQTGTCDEKCIRLEEHVLLVSTRVAEDQETVAQLKLDVLGQDDCVAKLAEKHDALEAALASAQSANADSLLSSQSNVNECVVTTKMLEHNIEELRGALASSTQAGTAALEDAVNTVTATFKDSLTTIEASVTTSNGKLQELHEELDFQRCDVDAKLQLQGAEVTVLATTGQEQQTRLEEQVNADEVRATKFQSQLDGLQTELHEGESRFAESFFSASELAKKTQAEFGATLDERLEEVFELSTEMCTEHKAANEELIHARLASHKEAWQSALQETRMDSIALQANLSTHEAVVQESLKGLTMRMDASSTEGTAGEPGEHVDSAFIDAKLHAHGASLQTSLEELRAELDQLKFWASTQPQITDGDFKGVDKRLSSLEASLTEESERLRASEELVSEQQTLVNNLGEKIGGMRLGLDVVEGSVGKQHNTLEQVARQLTLLEIGLVEEKEQSAAVALSLVSMDERVLQCDESVSGLVARVDGAALTIEDRLKEQNKSVQERLSEHLSQAGSQASGRLDGLRSPVHAPKTPAATDVSAAWTFTPDTQKKNAEFRSPNTPSQHLLELSPIADASIAPSPSPERHVTGVTISAEHLPTLASPDAAGLWHFALLAFTETPHGTLVQVDASECLPVRRDAKTELHFRRPLLGVQTTKDIRSGNVVLQLHQVRVSVTNSRRDAPFVYLRVGDKMEAEACVLIGSATIRVHDFISLRRGDVRDEMVSLPLVNLRDTERHRLLTDSNSALVMRTGVTDSDVMEAGEADSDAGEDSDNDSDSDGGPEGSSGSGSVPPSPEGSDRNAESVVAKGACFMLHSEGSATRFFVSSRVAAGVKSLFWTDSTEVATDASSECMPMHTISHILLGKQTSSFGLAPDTDADRCFSIMSDLFVLDLEADSAEQRQEWIWCLQRLLDLERALHDLPPVTVLLTSESDAFADDRTCTLMLACHNLPMKAGESLNPLISVFHKRKDTGKYAYVGQTERLNSTSEPAFRKFVKVNYRVGKVLPIRFNVYHVGDSKTTRVREQDRLASAQVPLNHLLAQQSLELPLTHSRDAPYNRRLSERRARILVSLVPDASNSQPSITANSPTAISPSFRFSFEETRVLSSPETSVNSATHTPISSMGTPFSHPMASPSALQLSTTKPFSFAAAADRVYLQVKCINLPSRDTTRGAAATKAVVAVFEKNSETEEFDYVDQTEVCEGASPSFTSIFGVSAPDGNTPKELVFNVYDMCGDAVTEKDCLGLVLVELGDIMEQQGEDVSYQLVNSEDEELSARLADSLIVIRCVGSPDHREVDVASHHSDSFLVEDRPEYEVAMASPTVVRKSSAVEEFSVLVSCKNLPPPASGTVGNPLVALFVQHTPEDRFRFIEYSVKKKPGDPRHPYFIRPFSFQVALVDEPNKLNVNRSPRSTSFSSLDHNHTSMNHSSMRQEPQEKQLRFQLYDLGSANSKNATDEDVIGCVTVGLSKLRKAAMSGEPLELAVALGHGSDQQTMVVLWPTVQWAASLDPAKNLNRSDLDLTVAEEEGVTRELKPAAVTRDMGSKRVEIKVECLNLVGHLNTSRAPDAFVGFFSRGEDEFGDMVLVAQTEAQRGQRSPTFSRTLVSYIPANANPELLLTVFDATDEAVLESHAIGHVLLQARDLLIVPDGTSMQFLLDNPADPAMDARLKAKRTALVVTCTATDVPDSEVDEALEKQRRSQRAAEKHAGERSAAMMRRKSLEEATHGDRIATMIEGCIFMKHAFGRGKPSKKSVFYEQGRICWSDPNSRRTVDASHSVPLSQVMEVLVGKASKAFTKKSALKADPRHCFSLVYRDRTLDLEASTADVRDIWVKGLRRLLSEISGKSLRSLTPGQEEEEVEEPWLVSMTNGVVMPFSEVTDQMMNLKLKYNRKDSIQPSKRYAITVTCANLIKTEWMKRVDPLVALFTKNDGTGELEYVAQTEWLKNDRNPTFTKKFVVRHHYGDHRDLLFNVYDVDSPNVRVEDRIGGAVVDLQELLERFGGGTFRVEVPLAHFTNEKRNAKLVARKTTIVLECEEFLKSLTTPEMAMPVPRPIRPSQRGIFEVMRDGRVFCKYSYSKGKAQQRNVFYVETLQGGLLCWCEPGYKFRSSKHCLNLASVTDVLLGKQTRTFQKAGASKSNADRCFSIVCRERTLDLEAESLKQRNAWVEGMRGIADRYGLKRIQVHKTPMIGGKTSKKPTQDKMLNLEVKFSNLSPSDKDRRYLLALYERSAGEEAFETLASCNWILSDQPDAHTSLTVSLPQGMDKDVQFGLFDVHVPSDDQMVDTVGQIDPKDRVATLLLPLSEVLAAPDERGVFQLLPEVSLPEARKAELRKAAMLLQLSRSSEEGDEDTVKRQLFGEQQPYEFAVRCKGLIKRSGFNKRCAVVAMFISNRHTAEHDYVGQTEIAKDDSDPVFLKKFVCERLEEGQTLIFNVYDADNSTILPSDLLGGVEVSLDDLVKDIDRPHEFVLHSTDAKLESLQQKNNSRLCITCSAHATELSPAQQAEVVPYAGRDHLRTQLEVMREGRMFIKYPFGQGRPAKKVLFFDDSDPADQLGTLGWCEPGAKVGLVDGKGIRMAGVTNLILGKRTPAFHTGHAQTVPSHRCFSVVSTDRTLDVEAPTAGQCKAWVNGMAALMRKHELPVAVQIVPTFHHRESTRRISSNVEQEMSRKVEIFVQLRGMPKKHAQSKAGILAALLERASGEQHYYFYGQLGWVINDANPDFETKLLVDFDPKVDNEFRLNFYHVQDSENMSLVCEGDKLGSTKTRTLSSLLNAPARTTEAALVLKDKGAGLAGVVAVIRCGLPGTATGEAMTPVSPVKVPSKVNVGSPSVKLSLIEDGEEHITDISDAISPRASALSPVPVPKKQSPRRTSRQTPRAGPAVVNLSPIKETGERDSDYVESRLDPEAVVPNSPWAGQDATFVENQNQSYAIPTTPESSGSPWEGQLSPKLSNMSLYKENEAAADSFREGLQTPSPGAHPVPAYAQEEEDLGPDEDERLFISVKCTNLPSSCNPVVTLFEMNGGGDFEYVGQTERHTGTADPAFLVRFSVPFSPGVEKRLMFNAYDVIRTEICDDDRLASAVITLDRRLIAASSQSREVSFRFVPAKASRGPTRASDQARLILSIARPAQQGVTSPGNLSGSPKDLARISPHRSLSIGPSGMPFNSAYTLNPFLVKKPSFHDILASRNDASLGSFSFSSNDTNISFDDGNSQFSWKNSPKPSPSLGGVMSPSPGGGVKSPR